MLIAIRLRDVEQCGVELGYQHGISSSTEGNHEKAIIELACD